MRWKTEEPPSIGDKKIVKHFAFLPVRCMDNTLVWFEFCYMEYVYNHDFVEYTEDWFKTGRNFTKEQYTKAKLE